MGKVTAAKHVNVFNSSTTLVLKLLMIQRNAVDPRIVR